MERDNKKLVYDFFSPILLTLSFFFLHQHKIFPIVLFFG